MNGNGRQPLLGDSFIEAIQRFEDEIHTFLYDHRNCSPNWEEEASPMLYSVKCFESTIGDWVVVKCEKCGKEETFLEDY